MIEWRREHQNPFAAHQDVRIKLVGIGGTGSSVLDRIALDGIDKADLVAVNTDVQSLKSSVASQKVQLGKSLTCGLGAGGDPEVGYAAAMEAEKELLGVMDNVPLLFVCVGLGGGTGSGAAPVIVNLARQQGAFVVVFATLPFEFEGNRRVQQARAALEQIYQSADCVICFENDRLGENILPRAGIHKAFGFAEQTISQSVRAIAAMVNTPGLIEIGFDELLTVMRNHDPRCLFGHGEAEGEARGLEALGDALRSPLMDKGRLLTHADSVLVNIMGGEDLTLSEVQKLMTELNQHINENTHVLMGTAIDKRLGSKLSVTLISSLSNEEYMALVDKRTRLQQSQPGGNPASLPGYSSSERDSPSTGTGSSDREKASYNTAGAQAVPAPIPAPSSQYTEGPRRTEARRMSAERAAARTSSPPEDEPTEDDSPEGQNTFTPLFSKTFSPAPEPSSEPEPVIESADPEPVQDDPEEFSDIVDDQPEDLTESVAEIEQATPAPTPKGGTWVSAQDADNQASDEPSLVEEPDADPSPPPADPFNFTFPTEDPSDEEMEKFLAEADSDVNEETIFEPETETVTSEFSEEEKAEEKPRFNLPKIEDRPAASSRPRIKIRAARDDEEDSTHPDSPANDERAKRGRFEKYEPTIIDGEDYDVPTFMRRSVKITQ